MVPKYQNLGFHCCPRPEQISEEPPDPLAEIAHWPSASTDSRALTSRALVSGRDKNGYIESFNGRMRDELLNESLFLDLDQARQIIAAWVTDYNRASEHPSVYVIEEKRLC